MSIESKLKTILGFTVFLFLCVLHSHAQKNEIVKLVNVPNTSTIKIYVGKEPFCSFLYPDTLEKPVLFAVHAANGVQVTRGFPLNLQAGEPTDHPHHAGIWFNFENVNGLDFWNNSFAISADKKQHYGWIKVNSVPKTVSGKTGTLIYEAQWKNQANEVLLNEETRYVFSGSQGQRIIDRITTLTAATDVLFKDAKDGLLGIRLAHALQIPTQADQEYTDKNGIKTMVKAVTDSIANGNYLTSEGKTGNDAWSTRAAWCKVFAKMGNDSVSVTVIDHPANPNYPTYWHARGYGLFAANPLGENIFTNGKLTKNLQLKKGDSVVFRYRIVINNGKQTPGADVLNQQAADFAKTYSGNN
jgi:hypothetical protein